MKFKILKVLSFSLLLLLILNSGNAQFIDKKPGKIFEVQGVITCKNLKNIYKDMLTVNLYVKSMSKNIKITGVFQGKKKVPKAGPEYYFKSFDFHDMRPGKTVFIKIAYKNKKLYPLKIKFCTIAIIKLDYFITYVFPKKDSIIDLTPNNLNFNIKKKTVFRWTSTGSNHNSYFYLFNESGSTGTSLIKGNSNGNAFNIPSNLVTPGNKYKVLNAVQLGNIKLGAEAASTSYMRLEYEYSHYFRTK